MLESVSRLNEDLEAEYEQMLLKMVEDQEPKIEQSKKEKSCKEIDKLVKECLNYLIDKDNSKKEKSSNLLTIFNARIDQDTDSDCEGMNI